MGTWVLAALPVLPILSCGGLGSDSAGAAPSTPTGQGGGFVGGPGSTASTGGFGIVSGSGGAGGLGPLPPEREVESSFEVPVATGRYVWIANPTSGRVAYVDASTLKVRTAEAGNLPTYLAPVPGTTDGVVVLNVLSHDATFLRADAAGRLTSIMVKGVAARANAWAVSPDGHFALAWTDARRALAAAPGTGSLEGFQDLTAIDLRAQSPVAATVAVGYRPVSVTFSADGTRAYVVTQDGVSVVGLSGGGSGGSVGSVGSVAVLRDVPLTADPTESADTRDVTVTRDGRAVVRREGSADVRIVDLNTGVSGVVTLAGPVTDLDVTSDGARAVAVVREVAQVVILPLATAAADPSTTLHTTLAGEVVGSVVLTADDSRALLYSNATDSERVIVLDLTTGAAHPLRVHAPVSSLFPSPDGQFAIVLHHEPTVTADAGAPSSTDAAGAPSTDGGLPADGGASSALPPPPPPPIAAAFSVVPLDGLRSARIQETTAVPQAVAIAPQSTQALVTVRDDEKHAFGVYVVGLPSLQVSSVALASPPIATGVVAGATAAEARGYVAQSHPDGRITFIPLGGGAPQTLTGFDLGARVVDGVNP